MKLLIFNGIGWSLYFKVNSKIIIDMLKWSKVSLVGVGRRVHMIRG